MKKVFLFLCLFGLLIVIGISCNRPESSVTPNVAKEAPYQGVISLEEAKSWFTNTTSLLSASARQSAPNNYERKIDWNSAKKIKQSSGVELVVAPIYYNTNRRPGLIRWDSKTPENEKRPDSDNVLTPKECLLVYKNKSGIMQSQIVQYASTKEYKQKKQGRITDGDFTGYVIVMTWEEKVLLGFEFKDGKEVKSFSTNKAPGGRPSNCDYTYYQSVVASCNSCGSNCTQCNVIISGGYQAYCTSPSSGSGTDSNTGISYGGSGGPTGTYTGSPYDSQYSGQYSYTVPYDDNDDNKKKYFVFKLKGTIMVTNSCQHAALKTYLSIIPNLEIDYNNKVAQCLTQAGYSGDALTRVFGGLALSAVAKEMANRPWSTFLTVARGLMGAIAVNNMNANACIEGVQGDTNAEIEKAYNKYVEDFNKPCF